MKRIIKDILQEHEVPKELKERVIKSAKAQLLLKDLSELFGKNIPKSSMDVAESILLKSKKNKKL